MSIQANINNILSLTGLIAAGTEARREKQKEKKAEETREAAIRGDEGVEATLSNVEPKTGETGETQAAPATEYDDLLELRQHRSSGSPLARERTRQVAQELGMTEAQFASAMSQTNMSQIRERAALRRSLASGMSPEERRRTAGLRQAVAGGDYAAADELRAMTGGTLDGQE